MVRNKEVKTLELITSLDLSNTLCWRKETHFEERA